VKDARASDVPEPGGKKPRKPRAPKDPNAPKKVPKETKEPKVPKKDPKESPLPPKAPQVVLEEECDSEDDEFEADLEQGDTCRERLRKMLASECKLPMCESKGCESDDLCKPIEDELRAPSGDSMDERLRKILAEAAADGGFEEDEDDEDSEEEEIVYSEDEY